MYSPSEANATTIAGGVSENPGRAHLVGSKDCTEFLGKLASVV